LLDFVRYALKYAAVNLHVLPLAAKTKIPAISKENGGKGVWDATTSTGQIEAWGKKYPNANIGLFPGRSGLIGLDFDKKSGGLETLEELRMMHPELDADDVWVVATPSGGWHYYFSVPAGVDVTTVGNPVGLMPGFDIRNDSTYTVLPPSVHPDGGTYTWSRKQVDWPSELPQALLTRILTARAAQPAKNRELLDSDEPIHERHGTLMSIGGGMRGVGHDGPTIKAALMSINERRCQPAPLPESEIDRMVENLMSKPANVELVSYAMKKFGLAEDPQFNRVDPNKGRIKPTFRRGNTIKPVEVEWLIPGYFPRGKCSLLWGFEGRAKSYMLIGLAALITQGKPLPYQSELDAAAQGPGDVAFLAYEDDPSDTIVPRLIKCGADMNRVHIMHYSDNLISYKEIEGLSAALDEIPGLRMVGIDPLTSFGAGLSDVDEQSVRAVMDPLNRMAFGKKYAIIGVKHANKKSNAAVADRTAGGRAWTAVARSAVLCGHDNEKQQERYHTYGGLIPTKGNLAGQHMPLAFEIVDGRFTFTGEDPTLTAERLFPLPPKKDKV
jgi:hypothetical protein